METHIPIEETNMPEYIKTSVAEYELLKEFVSAISCQDL